MYSFVVLRSADVALGRADYSTFSDQTLMELLFEGFEEEAKQTYQDEHGLYLDVCDWSCVTCDSDERVTRISTTGKVNGPLRFFYIPPKVESLSMSEADLTGPIDFENLPNNLEELCLSDNRLEGSIELTNLPQTMLDLNFRSNTFEGSIDLTKLPESMGRLYLHFNQLTIEN